MVARPVARFEDADSFARVGPAIRFPGVGSCSLSSWRVPLWPLDQPIKVSMDARGCRANPHPERCQVARLVRSTPRSCGAQASGTNWSTHAPLSISCSVDAGQMVWHVRPNQFTAPRAGWS
jgi:hypothetical protein